MNLNSENQRLLLEICGGALLLLVIVFVMLRSGSKKRKQKEVIAQSIREKDFAQSSVSTSNRVALDSKIESPVQTFSANRTVETSNPEFGELFVVEDPLEGSGYLATQINRESSYISDFEIRALIKRFETTLLSQTSLQSGFAVKGLVAGKMRTILFGEVEAIAQSSAAFHPEIAARIEGAQSESKDFRLLAIDGLVYGVFQIRA